MENISFIEKFKEYNINSRDIGFGPIGWRYIFTNGYGASVVNNDYGKNRGLYMVAVLKKVTDNNYDFCFDTEITDEVVDFLNNEEVIDILKRIKNLKPID